MKVSFADLGYEGMNKAKAREVADRVRAEFPTAYVAGPYRAGQGGAPWYIEIDGEECHTEEKAEQRLQFIRRFGTLEERASKRYEE